MNTSSGIKITLLLLCLFMALMVGLFINKMLAKPTLTMEELNHRGVFLFAKSKPVTDFDLLDDKGQSFTRKRLVGSWSILFFGFTSCMDVCPATLSALNKIQVAMHKQGMNNPPQFIFVSVDPKRDTVSGVHDYVQGFNPAFIGVTGDFLKLHAFATNLNAAFKKQPGMGDNYGVDHSAYLFLVNPRGEFQGFIKPPFGADGFIDNYKALTQLFPY